jgi:hypothetical protein
MHRRVPDTQEVQRLLGWTPTNGLPEILADMVEHPPSKTAVDQQVLHAV